MAEPDETRALVRFLSTFLQSLRRALELPFEAQLRQNSASVDLFRAILLDVEKARLSIAPIRLGIRPEPRPSALPYLAQLSNELGRLTANPDYVPILRALRFRMLPEALPREREKEVGPRFGDGLSTYEAIQAAIGRINEFANPPGTSDNQRELFELRSILPLQKIAPAQFEIRNDKLAVRKSRTASREEDESNIKSAKSELQTNGDKIIKELEQSNCDRRLLNNLQYLQAQLVDETDAIKIGLTNLSCEFMCSAFEHELPSAVSSMLKAHTRGVQLFVGQFPEWNRFLENAATAHLEAHDIGQLRIAADQLVTVLKSEPEAVDPDVPKTLAFLTQLLDNPTASAKRAAFAVLRSIENLISLVFKYGAEFGQKTVSKTIESASTASKIIVITLLTIALGSATAIGPIATKVPEMGWLQTASQIVKRQLEKMAGE